MIMMTVLGVPLMAGLSSSLELPVLLRRRPCQQRRSFGPRRCTHGLAFTVLALRVNRFANTLQWVRRPWRWPLGPILNDSGHCI